jgi:hypothetical protein
MAAISDIYIDAGTSFQSNVTVNGTDGFPLDMSSHTIRCQIRRHPQSLNFLDVTTSTPTIGTITLSLTPTQTASLKFARYQYDVEIILNGVANRVIEGQVFVNPNVTR